MSVTHDDYRRKRGLDGDSGFDEDLGFDLGRDFDDVRIPASSRDNSEPDDDRRSALRREVRAMAEYEAGTHGGNVDEIEVELMPYGHPYSENQLIQRGWIPKEHYTYTNASGVILYQMVRLHHRRVDTKKAFVARRPKFTNRAHGDPGQIEGWHWGKGDARVIYRWHEVAERTGEVVYVCEGEKDADRLAKLGLLATTVDSQHWTDTAAEALRGRDVVVLVDRDEKGETNADNAVEHLTNLAKSIKVVRLPGLKHKGDVSDWLDSGHTKEDLESIVTDARISGLRTLNIVGLKGKEVPVQPWALQDKIPLGNVTLFSGHGATGKSLMQLQLSVACVLGRQWLDAMPLAGSAMFIDAEDDENVIHKRLADILRHYNADFDQLAKLHIHPLVGADAVLAEASGKSGRVVPTKLYHSLFERAADIKPSIIGLASSADMFAGNEIDRGQVRQFITLLTGMAKAANSAVVLISHPSLSGLQAKTGLSGSTAWHNSTRARMVLSSVESRSDNRSESRDEPTNDMRMLEFQKNNYGPVSAKVAVRWQNGVFVPIDVSANQAERAQKTEDLYIEILGTLLDRGENLSANKTAPNYAVSMIFQQPMGREFVGKEEVEAVHQRLLAANKIHIKIDGSASKLRRRIVLGPKPEESEVPM